MSWLAWWNRLRETDDERLARLYPAAGSRAHDANEFDRLRRDYIRKMFAQIEAERAADDAAIRRDAARLKAERKATMQALMGQQHPRRRRWVPWW